MKFLMTILVLMLAFSGFSTVSHAMSESGHVVSSDTQDHSADTSDISKDDSKAGKSACSDCLHGCSHMVFLPDSKMPVPELASIDPVIQAKDFVPYALTISLLRPPKSLA